MRSEPLAPVGLRAAWRSSADSQSNSPLDEATRRTDRACPATGGPSRGNDNGTTPSATTSAVSRDRSGLVLAVPPSGFPRHFLVSQCSQEFLDIGETFNVEGIHECLLEVVGLVVRGGVKAEWKLKRDVR